ncbi:hypothetical protein NQ317_014929 [Molorchus minor]|uniref:THIF-type NAD/FAD binding fold domain-containing protein n=1 Tax=Molorchus minor TaxID=1323400 RepID=A0ABQ9K046_9CUCU|nr:hypothetical protein NQ317_014929 [Molorchus minor]
MSSPAPKSPEQSDKSKKYDRQLRLWGDHGQKLVENSKVCLINATALGTEILKSLVLPGIGSFTIVDGEKITEEDLGSNFFLENDSLGMSRAQVATQSLLELNPDVRGDYIDESPEHVMSHTQDFFSNFSVVVATALPEKVLIPLSRHLWDSNVPLVVCRSIGFLGYIRLQIKEHTVIEGHPDNENPDLRLDKPWPALKEHLDSINVATLDPKARSHVPPIIIVPCQKPERRKTFLRRMIRESPIPDESGVKVLEENFEEAIHYVNTCVSPIRIPPNVQAILDDDSCFAFLGHVLALRELVQAEEALPVRGSLPDMAADTETSSGTGGAGVQEGFANSEDLGMTEDAISENEVKLVCKHASELHVIRGKCIADEYQHTNLDLSSYLEDPDSLMFYYVILRGLERFISEFNTYPGQLDDHVEPDVLKLKSIIGKLMSEWSCSHQLRDERVHEVCRYGGCGIALGFSDFGWLCSSRGY